MAASPIKVIFSEFNKLEGVRGVIAISKDGFPIEIQLGATNIDPEALSALVVTLFSSADKLGNELRLGDIEIITIEYNNNYVLIQDLDNALFTVIADRRANLGRIRFEMKRQKDRVRAAL